jgi:hypothetical protein
MPECGAAHLPVFLRSRNLLVATEGMHAVRSWHSTVRVRTQAL